MLNNDLRRLICVTNLWLFQPVNEIERNFNISMKFF